MILYLIRHGQRNTGNLYDSLTEKGKIQAKELGKVFKKIKIDYVYCSPQRRAQQTLRYIKPYLNKKTNIEISEFVKQQGAPQEVGKDVIESMNIINETDEQTQKRVYDFIKILKKKHKNDVVLLSTHKQFITFAIKHIVKLKNKTIYVPSASLTYFEFDNKGKLINYKLVDISHLNKIELEKVKSLYKNKDAQHNWKHILKIRKNVELLRNKEILDENLLNFFINYHGLKDYVNENKKSYEYEALIRSHKNPESNEEKLVYDANMLTNIGKDGVKKALAYGKRIGRSKENTYKYLNEKIKEIKFYTKKGKIIGKMKLDEMKNILK